MARYIDEGKPRYVIYLRGHRPPDVDSRVWIPIFEDIAEARAFIDQCIKGQDYTIEGNTLYLPGDYTLKCDRLTEVMVSLLGEAVLDPSHIRNIFRFRNGSWEEDHRQEPVVKAVQPSEPKAKPPKVVKAPKAIKPGKYITIGDLCAKWKIAPVHARNCLRASDLVKPEFGWAFDPKDIPSLKKLCGVK